MSGGDESITHHTKYNCLSHICTTANSHDPKIQSIALYYMTYGEPKQSMYFCVDVHEKSSNWKGKEKFNNTVGLILGS